MGFSTQFWYMAEQEIQIHNTIRWKSLNFLFLVFHDFLELLCMKLDKVIYLISLFSYRYSIIVSCPIACSSKSITHISDKSLLYMSLSTQPSFILFNIHLSKPWTNFIRLWLPKIWKEKYFRRLYITTIHNLHNYFSMF